MAGFFEKLQQGLSKTRDSIVRGIDSVFNGYSVIDDEFYEELEETLIMGDLGINATSRILDTLKEQVREKHITDPASCRALLVQDIWQQMRIDEHAYDFENQKSIIFVIGVNGVGKTTSVGKGQKGHNCSCRHIQGRGYRTARGVGEKSRYAYHNGARGRRSRKRYL